MECEGCMFDVIFLFGEKKKKKKEKEKEIVVLPSSEISGKLVWSENN